MFMIFTLLEVESGHAGRAARDDPGSVHVREVSLQMDGLARLDFRSIPPWLIQTMIPIR